ncbi:MAG: zinc dependent phospholipase C family protein [Ruminococcus sp.]|nr:zinc dependent phospholipase C family protein [Ruminococcus sp.]
MKQEILLAAAVGLYCRFGIKKAYAWSSNTHEDIVKKALMLLETEKKVRPAAFYKDWHSQLLKGCIEPDKSGDMDKGPGKHYYSCVNPKGKELPETKGYYKNRLGNFSPSARTLFCANYTSAISLYKSGNTENAMISLGRALHFVSDMGCTVHVSNMKYQDKPNNIHFALEKHINTTCTKYTAQSYDKRLSKYYEKDNLGEAFNRLVKYAGKFVETISHLDPRAFDDTAKNVLPVVQQNVMAVLLKFYDDCMTDKGNYVIDKKLYTFRNEATGLILTVGSKGLSMEKQNKELEQKLCICLRDNGTAGLKIADGGYVNASCKGYDYLKIDGMPAQFRFEAQGKRRFIITTESSGYEKVLTNSKGGGVAVTEFEPENPLQIWILN